MRLTYKYYAICTKETNEKALGWLELCRQLYNLCLEQRNKVWKSVRKSLSRFDQQNELPLFKKVFSEFTVIPAQTLQDVVGRVDLAYQSFFRRIKIGGAGFPRFKGYGRYDSLTLTQSGWKLEGNKLIISRLGTFKLKLHRPILGEIKTVTVRKSAAGKWYVTFSCDNVPPRQYPATDREVGLDVGIENFIYDSDGNVVENNRFLKQSARRLKKQQRTLSRRKKGSKRRNKARVQVAKTHERIANQRKDFTHKTSRRYVERYQRIYVEDLQIKNMVRNKHLSKSIADASWGQFFGFLGYKAEEAGRQLIKVRPHNTSQTCSVCGTRYQISLSTRTFECPNCGLVLNRDANAALNILRAGQALQALTRSVGMSVA